MGIAFYYPAYSAWLPALVPESDLMAVNGFEGMVRPTIGQAIGPGVAGVLVGAVSPGAALAVAAAASGLGLLALTLVPLTPVRRSRPRRRPGGRRTRSRTALADMREGFAYMVRTPWLLATLLFASLMILVMMGPLRGAHPVPDQGPARRRPRRPRRGDGGLRHRRRGRLAGDGVAADAPPLPDGDEPDVGASAACRSSSWASRPRSGSSSSRRFVLGAMWSAPMVIWGTLLQRRVPPHMLGRVVSLDFFVSISLMPVSMALAGPVSEAIGLRTTFLIAGIVPGVVAVVAIVWARLPADEIAHPLRDEPDRPTVERAGRRPAASGHAGGTPRVSASRVREPMPSLR